MEGCVDARFAKSRKLNRRKRRMDNYKVERTMVARCKLKQIWVRILQDFEWLALCKRNEAPERTLKK
jgi:hypothetical protein